MPPTPQTARTASLPLPALLGALCTFCAFPSHAQDAPATVPDAPSAVLAALDPQTGAQSTHTLQKNATPTANTGQGPVDAANGGPKQTKRILGIVPNFRAVSADTKLPPQSVGEKFKTTAQQSFDYSSIVFSAILAGVTQADGSEPRFGTGISGYGQYLYHTYGDQTDENIWVQFILPAVLHQDSRYYTLGHGSVVHRAIYAFDRTLITRTDSGGEAFNASEIVGAGAASGISTWYYPSSEQNWTNTGQRWLQNVVIDGATFMFQEFWPDVNQRLFHSN